MATICPALKIQQFDDNGDPAVGWKLLTYETGTTTPKATYTAADGLTANTNPVILDARGEATVFLGSGTYRFRLTTDTDALKWTVDDIKGLVIGDGLVHADMLAIDEATETEMLRQTDAANVVTTRRMRQMFYAGTVRPGTGEEPPYVVDGTESAGWTVVLSSTGVYTVTHNLGLGVASLTVVPCATADGGKATSTSSGANSFVVKVYDSAEALASNPFRFIAIRWVNDL